jgi:hypothetical protein
MPKYILLIHGVEEQWESMTPAQRRRHDEAHARFQEEAGPRVVGSGELESAATATTIRGDGDGGLITTDGPFLETKEVLGGFYLIEAADLDEVTKLVALLPEVRAGHSGVEIRPVVDHG